MAIRTVKPTSPSLRYLTYVTYDEITKTEPEKGLLVPKRRTNGRNVYGRITVRHRGGGAKQMVRQVDFRREKYGIPARVAAIEYDPNRSARLALLFYRDGEKRYIIAPQGLRVGDTVMSWPQADILPGNALPVRNISVGKAGRKRWLGFRPTVRGTVMNPVDHPMGGGEGKGKGNHPMTPWGKPTKGYKTRRGAKPSDRDIVTRRTK